MKVWISKVKIYNIQRGDSLISIACKFKKFIPTLLKINSLQFVSLEEGASIVIE